MNMYARFLYLAVGVASLSFTFATIGFGFGHTNDPSNCRECHARVYEEFTTTGAHANLTCGNCHQNSDLDYSIPISFNLSWLHAPADTPHSAISVKCVDCHPDVLDELQNESEVHRRFYINSRKLAISSNAACIACHTHADVDLRRMRRAYVSYTVSCDRTGYDVRWNESDELGMNRTGFGNT